MTVDAHRASLLHLAVLGGPPGQEGSTRRRVYDLLQEHPGLHQRDVARRLDLAPAAAEHHLRHLVRSGLLGREEEAGFVRYYVRATVSERHPGAVPAADRAKLGLLRQARPLQLVANLVQAEGPVPMGELATAMGISAGTLTYQVKKLEKVGLVERRRDGNARLLALRDRDATVALLLAYEPPADLVAGFEGLWADVGL
ncbi:MAG: winged helix-turn-helix transcriptional regulator [Thermoplasmatota archaeon]